MASTQDQIAVHLNGESRQVTGDRTVVGLLADLGKDPRTVAIELNGEILPRTAYEATVLSEGDRLEVVQFVQGG